ncbi:MAG: hypothetical protein QM775_02290 [Pirellulales bacterium]
MTLRSHVGLLLLAICPCRPAALAADEPKSIPPDRVIGAVYGKPVTAGDVGLAKPIDVSEKFDAANRARWEQMGRIQQAFGLPIQERFVRDKKLVVTDAEIARFLETSKKLDERHKKEWTERLAAIAQELAVPNLAADKTAKLREEQKMLEGFLRPSPPPLDAGPEKELARMFILPWKIERELQRTYGGRVIFQQFGLEALDARRKLYEAAEAAGDLKFDDPGVRHLFYYYANMPHTTGGDEKALEKPWFFEEVD